MRDFSAYETSPADNHDLAARSQRWWHNDSRADSKAKLSARGQLQCACKACGEGYSSIHGSLRASTVRERRACTKSRWHNWLPRVSGVAVNS